MMYSITTERKLIKIEEVYGPNWQEEFPGKSIDYVYNQLTDDNRVNLFCKIDPEARVMLKELCNDSDQNIAIVLQALIEKEFQKLQRKRRADALELAKQFSQTGE